MIKLTFLEVPFEQKDEVKALGAKWHSKRRKWFVPEDADESVYSEWIPQYETEFNLRAIAPFYLIYSFEDCYKCNTNSAVVTFGALGCEYLDEKDDEYSEEGEGDEIKEEPVSFSYISVVPERLAAYIEEKLPNYFLDWSNTTESFYYMNHCEQCGAHLGDFFLHSEPEHAFFPQTPEEVQRMKIIELKPQGTVKLSASPHWGSMEFILKHTSVVGSENPRQDQS